MVKLKNAFSGDVQAPYDFVISSSLWKPQSGSNVWTNWNQTERIQIKKVKLLVYIFAGTIGIHCTSTSQGSLVSFGMKLLPPPAVDTRIFKKEGICMYA